MVFLDLDVTNEDEPAYLQSFQLVCVQVRMHLVGLTGIVDTHVGDNSGTHRDSATPVDCEQGHFCSAENAEVERILVDPVAVEISGKGDGIVVVLRTG